MTPANDSPHSDSVLLAELEELLARRRSESASWLVAESWLHLAVKQRCGPPSTAAQLAGDPAAAQPTGDPSGPER